MIMKIDFERIFPSSDQDARRNRMRLFKLLATQNDIIASAKMTALLEQQRPKNATEELKFIARSEQSYYYRVACSHLYEALGDFERCLESRMVERYQPLSEDGEEYYARLTAHSQDSLLKEYLKAIRNRTFHYGYDGKLINEGRIAFGADQTAATTRYLIAEDAIMVRVHEHCGLRGAEPALAQMHEKVVGLRSDFLRFVDRLVATVYGRHRQAFSPA
jgi:hypothetical protein